MKPISIRARNNLGVPVRLTLTSVGLEHEQPEILITIGTKGVALSTYYRVCIDADIAPNNEWGEVGSLGIDTKYEISLTGNAK